MWSGSLLLEAGQVAVTSIEVAVMDPAQGVTLKVDALGLTLTLDFIDSHHLNSNPDVVVGIEIIRLLPLKPNSFAVKIKMVSETTQTITAEWTAIEGAELENPSLTTE